MFQDIFFEVKHSRHNVSIHAVTFSQLVSDIKIYTLTYEQARAQSEPIK